jgi:signal peptidase I
LRRLTRGKAIELIIVGVLTAFALILPLYAGTKTYPLTIVQGSSMYPALQNGDLVVFKSPPQGIIANKTIIVFAEGDTGVPGLDSFLRPVVIHRIVGVVVQADGVANYRTKGDNNQFSDPALVPADHVLGVAMQQIPKAGLLLLFVQSPQGMVAVIGMISLFYLGSNESKTRETKNKEALFGRLAQMALNGDIPYDIFKRFELAKYADAVESDGLGDDQLLGLVDWMRKGELDNGWKVNKTKCPECASDASSFVSSSNQMFWVCPRCARRAKTG